MPRTVVAEMARQYDENRKAKVAKHKRPRIVPAWELAFRNVPANEIVDWSKCSIHFSIRLKVSTFEASTDSFAAPAEDSTLLPEPAIAGANASDRKFSLHLNIIPLNVSGY